MYRININTHWVAIVARHVGFTFFKMNQIAQSLENRVTARFGECPCSKYSNYINTWLHYYLFEFKMVMIIQHHLLLAMYMYRNMKCVTNNLTNAPLTPLHPPLKYGNVFLNQDYPMYTRAWWTTILLENSC